MEYIFAEEFEFILTSLLQISNRTTFFQYHSMSGGRFLVSLTEVSTSEKNWYADSCSKWETIITGCKKNLNTQARGTMWMLLFKILSWHHCAITVNSWHLLPRNFKLKIICQLCSIPMTSHNEHSVSREEVYVDRGSLTWWFSNPSDELSNFCAHYLLKLKWLTNKLVFNNMIGVWRV